MANPKSNNITSRQELKNRVLLWRIMDVNFNRAMEGMRVCEEVARFVLRDRKLQAGIKKSRHALKDVKKLLNEKFELVKARAASGDIGKISKKSDFLRGDFCGIYDANSQRVKEALRVLEEMAKLVDKTVSEKVKRIRFIFYVIEKKAVRSIRLLK